MAFNRESKYGPELWAIGKQLKEIGWPIRKISEKINVPLGTVKAEAAASGWTLKRDIDSEVQRLQRYTCKNDAVPFDGKSLISLAASQILEKQLVKVVALKPDDYKTLVSVMDGPEDHKSLILKDMGLWDLESSGETLQRSMDLAEHKILLHFSPFKPPAPTDSKPKSYDDPKKQALADAERAGRNALKLAADDPPPIKTWRDVEIASKLAGVADGAGTVATPLLNIALLNDPAQFAIPLDSNQTTPEKTEKPDSPTNTGAGDD